MLTYLPEGTVNKVIAKAPTVVLVNKANPVTDLKLQPLKDILSGKIKNWKEVGGNDAEIKNVLLQPCTTTIFAKRSAPFGKDINRLMQAGNPVATTNQLVEANEGASSNTKAFVDFAMSPEGQEIVASLKHIRAKK